MSNKIPGSAKKDYMDYVSDVLGVKSILLNKELSESRESTGILSGTMQVVPLLIYVANLNDYTADENDLLTKMIGALKMAPESIKVISLDILYNETEKFQSNFTIYFLDELNKSNGFQVSSENVITTYSPRFLLKNPEYKKNAWNDLQKVITYFVKI